MSLLKQLYVVGLILFSWITGIFILTTIAESLGFLLTLPYVVVFNVLFFTGIWYYCRSTQQAFLKCILPVIGLITVSVLIANYFSDYSYDGQGYHGEAVLQLNKDWNPFYNNIPVSNSNYIFVKCFSKASWVVNGFIYKMTGLYEGAKGSNLILICATFFISLYAVSKYIKAPFLIVLVSLFIAFNPVCLNMYLSSMLDTHVACTISILIMLCMEYLVNRSKFIAFLIWIGIVYLINLKFTAGVYACVFYGGLFAFLLFTSRLRTYKKFMLAQGLALLLGFVYFGYPTYVRNILEHGHVFHPLMGAGKLPGVFAMDYMSGNPVINFIKSIFAKTTFSKACTEHIQYKLPFTFSKNELERFGFAGVMVGGFGVWFSGVVLFSLALLGHTVAVYGRKISKEDRIGFLFLCGTILVSVLVNPHAYLARYVPQLWLLPVLVYIFFIYQSGRNNILSVILLIVMTVNCALICGYTYLNFVATHKRKMQLEAFASSGHVYNLKIVNHTAARILLDERHIKYRLVDSLDARKPVDTLYLSELYFQQQ